jgi:hypothetical protein
MTEAEIGGLLDGHDALVAACAEDDLSFGEFLAAYGEFPGGCGLEADAAADSRAILPFFHKRIAFHRQVAGIIFGFRQTSEGAVSDELRVFLEKGIMLRLRALVSRYPDFKAPASEIREY